MKKLTLKIVDKNGLYAKPATIAVNAANQFDSEIYLEYNNISVNMKSVMSIMYLAIPCGEEIKITAQGQDEEKAISFIKEALARYNVAIE